MIWGEAMAAADCKNSVDPIVFPGGRLERGIYAEVVGIGINNLAFFDTLDHTARDAAGHDMSL